MLSLGNITVLWLTKYSKKTPWLNSRQSWSIRKTKLLTCSTSSHAGAWIFINCTSVDTRCPAVTSHVQTVKWHGEECLFSQWRNQPFDIRSRPRPLSPTTIRGEGWRRKDHSLRHNPGYSSSEEKRKICQIRRIDFTRTCLIWVYWLSTCHTINQVPLNPRYWKSSTTVENWCCHIWSEHPKLEHVVRGIWSVHSC